MVTLGDVVGAGVDAAGLNISKTSHDTPVMVTIKTSRQTKMDTDLVTASP